MDNFLGKDGFNWWIGVVEDTDDPLHVGRCRVRIFGHHTENLQELPTVNLPWATPTYPTNNSKSFSTPMEGDYVFGFFGDGASSQMPIMLGVFPAIAGAEPNKNEGFSSQSTNPIKKDAPAGDAPVQKVNEPTTPRLARGVVDGTFIARSNANLDHACDFKFQINIDVGSLGLVNPAVALAQAIKNGKNKAATLIRMAMQKINEALRAITKGLLAAFSFDVTGTLSISYSFAKDVVRKINYYTKKVAQYVEDASTLYYFVQDIQQIVNYLKTLPANILAMAKQCITNFLGSVTNVTKQLQAIPGAVGNSVGTILTGLQTSTQATLATVSASSTSTGGTMDSVLAGIINNPTGDHSATLTTYLQGQPDASSVSAGNSSSSFNKSNTKSP